MTLKSFLLSILFSMSVPAIAAASVQSGGDDVGNGGDLLRAYFNDGQTLAREKVEAITSCSFAPDTEIGVANWILNNKTELANDVGHSTHNWITDKQATCAWTMPHMYADITLSYDSCATVQNDEDAAWVLVHESTHHLGFTDEIFPDKVAKAVMTAKPGASCPNPSQPNQPTIVGTQQIPGGYWHSCFEFDGNLMMGCEKPSNEVFGARRDWYTLDGRGANLAGKVRDDMGFSLAATFMKGEILFAPWRGTINNVNGTSLFKTYENAQAGHTLLQDVQLEYDPRGYLYLLSYGYGYQNDSGAFVQIVNAKGAPTVWEETLDANSIIAPQPNALQSSARFAVNDRWLVLNHPRTWSPSQSLIYVYDVSDPYAPKLAHTIVAKAKVNDLNNWIPALSDDKLFVPDGSELTEYDLKSGMEVASLSIPEPIVTGGHTITMYGSKLYVASQKSVYGIEVAASGKMTLEWNVRVANPEAKTISELHRFSRNLYVIWKDKMYGTDTYGGHRLTTISLP